MGRIILSLEDKILVISLYPVLHKEIGLKRLKVEAPFSFGIKARNEELVLLPNLLVSCEYQIIFKRSIFIIDQQHVKKLAMNPSGPGALSGFISDKADLSSFMVTGAVRRKFSLGVIRDGMRSKG